MVDVSLEGVEADGVFLEDSERLIRGALFEETPIFEGELFNLASIAFVLA